jgi:hypothetical protein
MRRSGFATPGLLIIAILLLAVAGVLNAAPAAARQEGSPAVGTPAVQPQQTQPAAQPSATTAPAAATPAAPATTDVVTLVLWYTNAADQDIINLYPLAANDQFVAGPVSGAPPVGTADFPLEGVPTIVLGDTTLTGYPRPDGIVERWTWFDDFEGARPGTLVIQVSGAGGAYQDYFGAATFVSRDEGGVGGVLTIALRPPSPAVPTDEAAAAEAPAEAAPADAAPADEAAAGDAATDQPDVTVEPGTEILAEPNPEGESPGGAEGGVVLDPGA